jgi:hypothetical protein
VGLRSRRARAAATAAAAGRRPARPPRPPPIGACARDRLPSEPLTGWKWPLNFLAGAPSGQISASLPGQGAGAREGERRRLGLWRPLKALPPPANLAPLCETPNSTTNEPPLSHTRHFIRSSSSRRDPFSFARRETFERRRRRKAAAAAARLSSSLFCARAPESPALATRAGETEVPLTARASQFFGPGESGRRAW